MDSPVDGPLMQHDPDRSWITELDPDHSKGTHSNSRKYFRAFIVLALLIDNCEPINPLNRSGNTSNTDTVFHGDIQRPRRELKMRPAAEYL